MNSRGTAAALLAAGAAALILTFRFSSHMVASPLLFVGLWTLMMLAMMAPSVLPTVLVFATSASPGQQSRPARTGLFVSGYLLSWAALGAVVALGQRHAWPLVAHWTRPIATATLALAGLYQMTPWKRACLTHCRTPLHFFLRHWRPGASGAVLMGAHHGLYCAGCCVGLMAMLVTLGMMNPAWMITVAVLILLEKATPRGDRLAVPIGVATLAAAAGVALGWIPAGMDPHAGMNMGGP